MFYIPFFVAQILPVSSGFVFKWIWDTKTAKKNVFGMFCVLLEANKKEFVLTKSLCLILLTIFFICKATDVISILLAKEKIAAVCNSDDCENEKTESEKVNDDQQLHHHSITLYQYVDTVASRVSFCYSAPSESEIFRNLLSPPPELV